MKRVFSFQIRELDIGSTPTYSKGGTQQKSARTWVMILSVPSPSSSLNMMSGLSFVTNFLNLGSSLVIRPSARPLAPSVFSETLGTCCLYTRGVLLPVLCLRPDPRGDAHCNDGPVSIRNANTAAWSVERSACERITISPLYRVQ